MLRFKKYLIFLNNLKARTGIPLPEVSQTLSVLIVLSRIQKKLRSVWGTQEVS